MVGTYIGASSKVDAIEKRGINVKPYVGHRQINYTQYHYVGLPHIVIDINIALTIKVFYLHYVVRPCGDFCRRKPSYYYT